MAKTLQDLLVDKEFAAKLFKQKTEEDVRKLFHSEGVEITDEELKNLKKLCSEIFNKVKDIGEDELENVAGGVSNATVGGTAMGALAGLGLGIANIKNPKETMSTRQKIASVAVMTLTWAIVGAHAGQTINKVSNDMVQNRLWYLSSMRFAQADPREIELNVAGKFNTK